jgi:hypothetical protein
MKNKITYNKYITDGIQDGTIKEEEVDGVRVYKVRGPKKGEEVDGYTNFSDTFVKPKQGE